MENKQQMKQQVKPNLLTRWKVNRAAHGKATPAVILAELHDIDGLTAAGSLNQYGKALLFGVRAAGGKL